MVSCIWYVFKAILVESQKHVTFILFFVKMIIYSSPKSKRKALKEAQDVDLYLRPLDAQLSQLKNNGFIDMEKCTPAVFHTLFLIWTNCQYYQRPARIVVLLQELCNLFIEQVSVFWKTQTIFLLVLLVCTLIYVNFLIIGFCIPPWRSATQRGYRGKSANDKEGSQSSPMCQRELPSPEGEASQAKKISALGFPVCHGFFTLQPIHKSHASAGGKKMYIFFSFCF